MNIFFLVVNGDNDGKQKVVHILQSQAQNCAWLRGQESNHGLGDYAPVLITERVGLCLHPAKREPACSLYGDLRIGGLPTALPSESEGFTVIARYLDKLLYQGPIFEPPVQPYTTPYL